MERRTDGRREAARRGRTGAFLACYTALWIVCALSVYAVYRLNHRTFLYVYDGMYQHFPAYEHICEYLAALLKGNPGKLGFFNLTLGQGADVLTTLNSYDFTDPVCWLTALLPMSTLGRYTAMIFVKLYLVGLTFGVFCRESGREDAFAAALGAIAYAFSGATLMTLARHPNYINWAYYFALMLAGGERYWRRGKKGLLVAAVFLNLLTSYYTFYMNAVMFAVYTVLRAVCRWAEEKTAARAKQELLNCLKTAGVCLLGALLSMVVLLPTLYAYSVNARFNVVTGYRQDALLYGFTYYPRLVLCLFAAYMNPSYYTHIGMNALVFPALVLLFTDKRRRPLLKAGLFACLLALSVPLAGRVMNGFGYVCNRWSYALVFVGCVAMVDLLPRMLEIRRKEGWIIAALAVAFAGLAVIAPKNDALSITWALLALMAVTVAATLLAGRLNRRLGALVLCGVVLLSALYQTVFTFAPWAGDYVQIFWPEDEMDFAFDQHSATAAANLGEGFGRVEEQEIRANLNARAGVHGTDWWWSLLPYWMADYYNAFDMNSVHQNCRYYGLDGRTELLETAAVRYYTAPVEEAATVPYGYERIETDSDAYAVYENRYALPVGYAYDGYMLRDDYERLGPVERQMAQMQCAVVESPVDGFAAVVPDTATQSLDYKVVEQKDLELIDGGIIVKADDGEVRLRVDVPEDCELYAVLNGTKLPTGDPSILTVYAMRENGDFKLHKSGWLTHVSYKWPVLRDNITFNLGHGAPGENDVILRFGDACRLDCGSIELVAVPMRPYVEQAEKLKAASMTDVEVSADAIDGAIELDAPGILQISVPYSVGWTARVDGEKAALIRSDDMYMALPLTAGAHTVSLRYETPGLKLGAALSLATLIGMIAWGAFQKRRKARAE